MTELTPPVIHTPGDDEEVVAPKTVDELKEDVKDKIMKFIPTETSTLLQIIAGLLFVGLFIS